MRIKNTFVFCFLLSSVAFPMVFSGSSQLRGTTAFPVIPEDVAPFSYAPAGNSSITLRDNLTESATVTREPYVAWDPFSIWVVEITVPTWIAVTAASRRLLRGKRPTQYVIMITLLLDAASFFTILWVLGPGSQQVIPFLRIWARASFEQSVLLGTALIACVVGLVAVAWKSRKLSGMVPSNFSFEVFQKRNTARGLYNFDLPQVGFELQNLLPITARVRMSVYLGEKQLGMIQDRHGYYSGEMPIERPQPSTFWGNFTVPNECTDSHETLRLQARVDATDSHKRIHTLVRCFTYDRAHDTWFLEPTSWENLLKRSKEKGYKL
jgi:hypothetical protein